MSCNCNTTTANPSCSNPCGTGDLNTAQCESLPSALENFIIHFFGQVEKTEVDGRVVWTLPCDLSTGLPGNPRLPDEGLACYFKRLFEDGITGVQGPKGDPGASGTPGNNAYTVTLMSFLQPADGATVNVKVSANPVVKLGLIVFIDGSGWLRVDAAGLDSTYTMTMIQPLTGVAVGATIAAGKVVVPTGNQGPQGETGNQGIQGPTGAQGSPGVNYSATQGYVRGTGSNYAVQLAFAQVTFGGEEAEVTLPETGTYIIHYCAGVYLDGTAAVYPGEQIQVKLKDITAGSFIFGSDRMVQCFGPGSRGHINVNIVVSVVGAHTLRLWAAASQSNKVYVLPAETTMFYSRLS